MKNNSVTILASSKGTDSSLVANEHDLYTSRPSAGFPVPGDDLVEESLNIHDFVVKNPTATFFVKVEGDSMEGAGIFSGDVLVVDRSIDPKNGQIVVAVIEGGLVVKELRKIGTEISLVSANEDYEPIKIANDTDCYVWGVVAGVVRKLL